MWYPLSHLCLLYFNNGEHMEKIKFVRETPPCILWEQVGLLWWCLLSNKVYITITLAWLLEHDGLYWQLDYCGYTACTLYFTEPIKSDLQFGRQGSDILTQAFYWDLNTNLNFIDFLIFTDKNLKSDIIIFKHYPIYYIIYPIFERTPGLKYRH